MGYLGNVDLAVNNANTYNIKVFSENMGHTESKKIVIIKECPKLLIIYGNQSMLAMPKTAQLIFDDISLSKTNIKEYLKEQCKSELKQHLHYKHSPI